MAIELATKFATNVDELFSAESKLALITNKNYDWTGAHTVKVYTVSTAPMNNYDRNGSIAGQISRYGVINDLDATTQELTLTRDRSFTFAIDKLDQDETGNVLEAASALARQLREVVVPEVDSYVYGKIVAGAGTSASAVAITVENIFSLINEANETLDDAMVPETERYLVVSPAVYTAMKQSKDINLDSDVAENMRLNGVIARIDGANIIRVPSVRLPENFGFALVHPSATVAPVKLEDYTAHENPPFINGSLVEGRIAYDAFVLNNKKKGIYYQPITPGA